MVVAHGNGTQQSDASEAVALVRVFGDRTDGTYLGIDDMHAHINIPAALIFARGWFERPARVTFVQPPGKAWKVATQLFPTSDPLVFTAPNIHYLMDSPTDFSNFSNLLATSPLTRPKMSVISTASDDIP